MAVTIATNPDDKAAAYRPIVFIVTSNRYTTNAKSITSTAVGATTTYTVGASHGFLAGDVVTPSGYTTNTEYHVKQTVTSVAATTVTTNFDSTGLATTGTPVLSRTNNNFKIKAEVIISSVVIGTTYRQPYLDGADYKFRFDVSGILQTQLSYHTIDVSTTAWYTSATNGAIKAYTVKFTEVYDDEDGLSAEQDNTTSGTKYALNITRQHNEASSIAAYTVDSNAKLLLTNRPANSFIDVTAPFMFSVVTDATVQLRARVDYTNSIASGGGGGALSSAIDPLLGKYGTRVYSPYGSPQLNENMITFSIYITHTAISTVISATHSYRLYVPAKNRTTFYWLNRLGGIDCHTFQGDIKRSVESSATMFQKPLSYSYIQSDAGQTALGKKAINMYEVNSTPMTKEVAVWLEELITSPNVWVLDRDNEILEPVVLLDGEFTTGDTARPVDLVVKYAMANELNLQSN